MNPTQSTVQATIVQTVEADLAQQTATAPTNTPTPTLTETPTETPTSTPTSTITNIPIIQLPLLAVVSCYSAAFITDVTVPDGTQFDPAADFTKAWRIQNTGALSLPLLPQITPVPSGRVSTLFNPMT